MGLQNIDELFEKNLGNYHKEPPSYVWDHINASLDRKERRKKRRFLWLFMAVAGLSGAFTIGYFASGWTGEKYADNRSEQTGQADNAAIVSESINESSDIQSNHQTVTTAPEASASPGLTGNHEPAGNTAGKHQQTSRSGNLVSNEKNLTAPVNTTHAGAPTGMPQEEKTISSSNPLITRSKVTGAGPQRSVNADPKPVVSLGTTGLPRLFKADVRPLATAAFSHVPVMASLLPEHIRPLTNRYRVFVEAFYGPQYVMTNSSLRDDNNDYQPYFGPNVDFKESYRYSWNTGVKFGFRIAGGLHISAGISYNQFSRYTPREYINVYIPGATSPDAQFLDLMTSMGGIQGMKINLFGGPNNGSPEFTPENFGQDSLRGMTQVFGTIEIPIEFQYRFGSRFGFTLRAGGAPAFLVRNEVSADTKERGQFSVGSTSDMKTFSFNGIFGLGLDYQVIPSRLSVFVDPTMRYSFTNWSRNPNIKMNPLYLSANVGLRVNF